MNQFTSENISEISTALSKAQGEITAAIMDKINPHFKSKYCSLNALWDACRKPLSNHGLALTQCMSVEGDQIMMTTILAHSGGQWIKSYFPVCNTKATLQVAGSALTYARKYSLASIVGISCDEDDDGNAGNNSDPIAQKKTEERATKTIDSGQVKHLESLIASCGPDFMSKVMTPKLVAYKLTSLANLPQGMYKNVEAFLIKSRDEFMSQSSLDDNNNQT
jgi:hypothetical protein